MSCYICKSAFVGAMGRRCTIKKIKCSKLDCLNVICLKCHPTMPGITDVSFMQMKRNNTPFNYTCQECSPRLSPVEASSLDVESVHLNVEPSILHAEIIVPTYDIPTQAIENNILANNIPAPANETVIRNPACPMTRLFKRMAEYRKAKNASRAQLCLGPLNSSVHPRCDARLDTELTISPIDVLEQQIIVTPDSEENGDQTSYCAGLHFYKLVQMLFLESEFVEVEEAYLKQNQTTRHTRLDQKLMQAKLFRLWENYDESREKNGSYKLLKRVAVLYTKKIVVVE